MKSTYINGEWLLGEDANRKLYSLQITEQDVYQ